RPDGITIARYAITIEDTVKCRHRSRDRQTSRKIIMDDGIFDGQLLPIGLDPPPVLVIIFAAINDVICRIDIDPMAIARERRRSITPARPSGTVVDVDAAQGGPLGGKCRSTVEGNPLVTLMMNLDILYQHIRRIDEHAVGEDIIAAIED